MLENAKRIQTYNSLVTSGDVTPFSCEAKAPNSGEPRWWDEDELSPSQLLVETNDLLEALEALEAEQWSLYVAPLCLVFVIEDSQQPGLT